MCGIVGMIGLKCNTRIDWRSRKLEYRGYDSAGIFVSDGTTDYLVKAQGRIQNLKTK